MAVADPSDVEDVAELVAWAATEGANRVPRGAGTGMPGGNVGAGVIVDFGGWTGPVEIRRDARTARVQPGVMGARTDAAARDAGLFLPALPSSADRCTVGGMVANNAADGTVTTLRRGGTPRALFHGLHVALMGGPRTRGGRAALVHPPCRQPDPRVPGPGGPRLHAVHRGPGGAARAPSGLPSFAEGNPRPGGDGSGDVRAWRRWKRARESLVDVRRRGWRPGVRRILEATLDLVAAPGGTLSGEHGDGRIRAPFVDRIWGRPLADAFRYVKHSLDPSGILDPGVILPLAGQDPLGGLTPHRETIT